MLTISLIVKNESSVLAGCLASLKPLQAPIHVIDTGSTDETVEIARAAGAAVFHFEWSHHFAEARNYGLSLITTPWVMVLDADERLHPNSLRPLNRFLIEQKQDPPKAYCFFAREAGLSGEWTRTLFPLHPDICFKGRVHETLSIGGQYLEHIECEQMELIRVPLKSLEKRRKHLMYLPWILDELKQALPGSEAELHYLRHLARTYEALQMGQKAYLTRKFLFEKYRFLGVQSHKVWQDLLLHLVPQLMYYESQGDVRSEILSYCLKLFPDNQTLLFYMCQDAYRKGEVRRLNVFLNKQQPELMEPGLQLQFQGLAKNAQNLSRQRKGHP